MAELSYGDVHRAVQDSMKAVHGDLQRISTSLGSVSQQLQHLTEIETAVRDLQRAAASLQGILAGIRTSSGQASDQRIAHMAQEIHDLRVRFATIERFADQMSRYINDRFEDEHEDRQYRAA